MNKLSRSASIGASDAAVIEGISPWKTPYQLWREKLLLDEAQPEMNDAQATGLRLESLIVRDLATATGLPIVSNDIGKGQQETVEHPVHRIGTELPLTATPDGWCYGRNVVIDAKTTASDEGWGEEWTEEIPPYYYTQAQQQIAVCQAGYAIYAMVLVPQGLRSFLASGAPPEAIEAVFRELPMRAYKIMPSQKWLDAYLVKARAFWWCVKTKTAPETASPADAKLKYPKATSVDPATATEDSIAAAGELMAIAAQMRQLKERKDALTAALMDATGAHQSLVTPDGRCLATWGNISAFDAEAFAREHPDLAREFGKLRISVSALKKSHPQMHKAYSGQGAKRRFTVKGIKEETSEAED